MPSNTESEVLSFNTWDQWSAIDVSAFVDAVNGCYCSLLVVHDAIESTTREREQYVRMQEEAWRMYRHMGPPHPEWERWMEKMIRIWRKFGPRGFPPPIPWMYPMIPSAIPGTSGTQAEATLSHHLSHPDEIMRATDELQIHRIEMASPGGWSFRGLGEPLSQLRKLIKDVCYRNRQERQRGDLQILREKLELMAAYKLTIRQIDIVSTHVLGDLRRIGDLIDRGQLSLEDEERRVLTNEPTPSKRRRTRRKHE